MFSFISLIIIAFMYLCLPLGNYRLFFAVTKERVSKFGRKNAAKINLIAVSLRRLVKRSYLINLLSYL